MTLFQTLHHMEFRPDVSVLVLCFHKVHVPVLRESTTTTWEMGCKSLLLVLFPSLLFVDCRMLGLNPWRPGQRWIVGKQRWA